MNPSPRPAPPGPQIFQYWHSEEVPDYVTELTATFARHNPNLPHRVYSEAAAEELIATHFGQRELDCFRACAVPSMQSDYFRYCSLLACGGVYADVDYECQGSLRPLIPEAGGALLFHGDTSAVNGAPVTSVQGGLLLFERSGHALLELALAVATLQIERRLGGSPGAREHPGRMAWFVTGPFILTGLYFANRVGSLERFADASAGTLFERFAATLRELVGDDDDRLARAFDGVRLSKLTDCEVVTGADRELPYKSTETHWINHRAAIYRSAG